MVLLSKMGGLKIIKTYNLAIEAEIDKGYLASQGIPSHIINDNAYEPYPLAPRVFSILLQVQEKDVEKARKLLKI